MIKFLPNIWHAESTSRPSNWVLFFTLLGFALRLQRLSFQPLWGDEGWSFYLTLQPIPDLIALTAMDIHPPGYYLLLNLWLAVIGVGAEEARLLSVLIGTLLIPAQYSLGRRLFSRPVGLAAAAVTTLMPLAVYYAQEVRMYGLVTLLGVSSIYCFTCLRGNGVNDSVSGNFSLKRQRGFASSYAKRDLQEPHRHLRMPGSAKGMAPSRFYFAAYLLTTTAALYTHYYAVLLVIAQFIAALGLTLKRDTKFSLQALYGLVRPVIAVGLLFLPWVIYLGPRLSAYVENKRDVEGYLPLNPLRFFGDHFIAFSLGHLAGDFRPYIWLALPVLLIGSIGFVVALYGRMPGSNYYLHLYLFLPLLIGYGLNLVFPFNPPFFERTLLLAAPAYWLFIAVGLVWLWRRQPWLSGGATIFALSGLLVGLAGFYVTPRYPHQDYRPLLQEIAARATPADTILASYQWQLGFYQAYLPEPRPRLFAVPGWGAGWAGDSGQPQLQRDLDNIFAGSPRLWFPAYQASGHIWEDQAEALISEVGYPALLKWYSPQTKLTLTAPPSPDSVTGPTANFAGRLQLIASQIGTGAYQSGRGIVPVDLSWHKTRSLGGDHRVSLRLIDAAGRTWASRDSLPQGGLVSFTDLSTGDTLIDRHGLLVSAGMPPGQYRLMLSVRRASDERPLDLLDEQGQPLGAELQLADVTVIDPNPPLDPLVLPTQFKTTADFDQQIRLVGFSLGHGPFKAGQGLPLTLFWQSLRANPIGLAVSVQLLDDGDQPKVDYQQEPVRPTASWGPGALVRDPHEVMLPAAFPPGRYRLSLAVVSEEQGPLPVAGQPRLLLTIVETVDRPHNFEPPQPQFELSVSFGNQARLIGLDLPQTTVSAGGQLPLTLHWQGLNPFDRDWKVFVHLIDEAGQIVTQQDQTPGSGHFPTTSWLADEFLADSYSLTIPNDLQAKSETYRLSIGFYDANDFSRLPVIENDEIVGDHLILDNWQITVE